MDTICQCTKKKIYKCSYWKVCITEKNEDVEYLLIFSLGSGKIQNKYYSKFNLQIKTLPIEEKWDYSEIINPSGFSNVA